MLERLRRLRRGDKGRAPHKPLLLLLLFARFVEEGRDRLHYSEARAIIDLLLGAFGATGHSPRTADPFRYLRSDRIWVIHGPAPATDWTPTALHERDPEGGFCEDIADLLRKHPDLAKEAIEVLLDAYFPPDQHHELKARLGIQVRDEAVPGGR